MIGYYQYNVNPKNHKTGDCSTRALTTTLNIPYDQALTEQCKMAVKYCYGITCKETVGRVAESHGWVKMKMPKKSNGKRYTVSEIDEITTQKQRDNGILVLVANHWTCVDGDHIVDIWDCRGKSIGNYWVKGD